MPQPVLTTDRLRMVPLSDEHLDLEIELDADPEVLRYIVGRARSAEEVVESHARRMALGTRVDGLGFWIAHTTGGDFVGLMMLPPGEEPGSAELGYRLLRRWWRRGLATEAARELIRYAFDTAGQQRVFAQTMAVNTGSQGVMRAAGMRYVRTFHPVFDHPLPGAEQGEVEYEVLSADRPLSP